jgi:hypothetical protein
LDADISTLRLPTVGRVDEARFPLNGEYVYVHRKGFTALLVDVVNTWVRIGKKPMRRNILGFRRSGKSYALATFACALRSKNFNVLYIHNCSYWAATPLEYLRAEALSTFYGFPDKQTSIVEATTIDEILKILTDCKVIVVADQVGELYQKFNIPGQGSVQTQKSVIVLKALAQLSNSTLVFTATSTRKTSAFVDCFNNCAKGITIPLFDGFSIKEFEIYRQRVPVYNGLDAEAVEKLERLTGFLPGLLSLPGGTDFKVSPTHVPANQPDDDRWINPLQRAVTTFVATCMTNIQDKHEQSHEAAVFGIEYIGDHSNINFDIVSIPDGGGMVCCPSAFCKDLLSDHMAATDLNHKKNRLTSLHADMKKVDQEPTKLGDAAEDYLIAFMEVHRKCPMQIPNISPSLFPDGHIPLTECKKFQGMFPNLIDLIGDYQTQVSPNAPTASAFAYFPSGKFLRYIDFVVRVLIKNKEGQKDSMVVVVGQITLSLPSDHAHTWKFFERDYLEWQGGYDANKVETTFVLAWFTPHSTPDLTSFSFDGQAMRGKTVNIAFNDFGRIDGILQDVFLPLCNPDRFKPCTCGTGCPAQCGCRKAGIPCRSNCSCRNTNICCNNYSWTDQET